MNSKIHITLMGEHEDVLAAIFAEQAKAKAEFDFSYNAAATSHADVMLITRNVPAPQDYAGLILRIANADDVVTDDIRTFYKPIKLAQVLDAAMSGAMLRRLKSPRMLGTDIIFKPFARVIEHAPSNQIVVLTEKEACFLCAILDAGVAGFARATAVTQLWGYHPDAESHAVDTTLYRLRQKLQALGDLDRHLVNDNGVYKWQG